MRYFNLFFKKKLKTSIISLLIIYISANLLNLYGDLLPSNFVFFNRVFVIIIFLFFFYQIILSKNKILVPGYIGLFLFITYSIILFITHGMSFYSSYYALVIVYNYIGFLIIINLIRSKTDLKIFGFIYLLFVGLGCFIYMYKWFMLGNWGVLRPSNLAVTGGNINANIVSSLMVICILIFENLSKGLEKKWNILLYLFYFIFIIGIFGLGSRFMSMIITLFLFISIYNKVQFKYILLFFSIFTLIVVINISDLFMLFSEIKVIIRILNSGIESDRLLDLITNTNYFLESPFFGQNIEKIFITNDQKISHVVYLNYLVEGGLFGYFFLFILFYSIFKHKILTIDYIGLMFLIFWLLFYFWSPSYFIMLVPVSYIYLINNLKT